LNICNQIYITGDEVTKIYINLSATWIPYQNHQFWNRETLW